MNDLMIEFQLMQYPTSAGIMLNEFRTGLREWCEITMRKEYWESKKKSYVQLARKIRCKRAIENIETDADTKLDLVLQDAYMILYFLERDANYISIQSLTPSPENPGGGK